MSGRRAFFRTERTDRNDSPGKGFRMDHIPSTFGSELTHCIDNEGNNVISFVIYPCEDLILNDSVELEISFPPNFQSTAGEVTIKAKQPEVFTGCPLLSLSTNTITFPWLEDATKYPISVWFYTVRNLLKKPKRSAWRTPILIKSSFYENKQRLVSNDLVVLLETPLLLKGITRKPVPSSIVLLCGAGRTQGRRNYMEDVDFIFEAVRVTDQRSVGVYGVLDGHGGKECAIFAAEEVPIKIAASLRAGMSCPQALFKSFIDTDIEFLRASTGNLSGSTANVMLWDRTTGFAYIANTADTRAVLCRCGIALDLSIDRKASDPEEIARIAESGGFVANGRVQGSLAVSRALGDARLKVTATATGGTVLIPDPEVTTFRPCSMMDDFVIIATDGLWDVMTSQAAVDYVTDNLIRAGILPPRSEQSDDYAFQNKSTPAREHITDRLRSIASSLADHAVDPLRSLDNVTVMIVLITDPTKPWGVRGDGRVSDASWLVSDGMDNSGDDQIEVEWGDRNRIRGRVGRPVYDETAQWSGNHEYRNVKAHTNNSSSSSSNSNSSIRNTNNNSNTNYSNNTNTNTNTNTTIGLSSGRTDHFSRADSGVSGNFNSHTSNVESCRGVGINTIEHAYLPSALSSLQSHSQPHSQSQAQSYSQPQPQHSSNSSSSGVTSRDDRSSSFRISSADNALHFSTAIGMKNIKENGNDEEDLMNFLLDDTNF